MMDIRNGTHARLLVATLLLMAPMGCDDGTDVPLSDAGRDSGPRVDGGTDGGVDGGDQVDAGPPVPGCTVAGATNYDAAATVNDGSCLFLVTFSVDLTAVTYDRADGVAVAGSFCTTNCPTLTDDDADEVWTGTAEVTAGTYTHHFVITSTTPEPETVPDFCQAESSTDRELVVGTEAVALDPVAFSGCTVLPVVVDGFYAASGFFGDAGDVTVTETCPERGGDGAGACRTWTYTRGSQGFAGVYWQHPENNFGAEPGFPMPQGATRVTFSAWGATGGESIGFLVGFAPDGTGDRDGFELREDFTLTTSPTDYTIFLAGQDYDLIAGGFGWVAGLSEGADPITFYIDDVQWERVPADLLDVPGCTDSTSSNYNPAATRDDGTCLYPVTFTVDMGCPDPAVGTLSSVSITGPFCGWCGSGFELTDQGGNIYSGTFEFAAGDLEFKFMVNGFASQEDLVGDGSCAPITDGSSFANRQITVDTAATNVNAVYGSCDACP